MSDEEDESMSEGFSASEEEWQPGKEGRGGESSDDDDSDFEEVPAGSKSGRSSVTNLMKNRDSKLSGVLKQQSAVKKRKPAGQSLRAKLYNKYRPPPKSLPSPSSGKNSPSASTSKGKSKNYQTPNEADNSDTDGSVNNYLVNPEEIDLGSSFYQNLHVSRNNADEGNISPVFDCNAGMKNLSDSDSEDNESSHEEQVRGTNYNFVQLLDNANSLERIKLDVSTKMSGQEKQQINTTNLAIDVESLLALGEKKQETKENVSKLCKTKSTRNKRHTKTRPTSTVDAEDSDESEFEEVAGRKRF